MSKIGRERRNILLSYSWAEKERRESGLLSCWAETLRKKIKREGCFVWAKSW